MDRLSTNSVFMLKVAIATVLLMIVVVAGLVIAGSVKRYRYRKAVKLALINEYGYSPWTVNHMIEKYPKALEFGLNNKTPSSVVAKVLSNTYFAGYL